MKKINLGGKKRSYKKQHRNTSNYKRLLWETIWTTWKKNGQILRKHNLPRLNQDDVENMNRQITSSEMEAIIELYPTKKCTGPGEFTGEFYQMFREEITPIPFRYLQKNFRGRNTPKFILWSHCHPNNKAKDATKKKITGQYHWENRYK